MTYRITSLLLLAACQFNAPGTTTSDAGSAVDAAGNRDAIDAPSQSCRLGTRSIGSDAGKLGPSTGGGSFATIACVGMERIVGVALDMSDQGVNGGSIDSAHGIELGCAAVTIDGTGGHTGTITTMTIDGNGGSGFTPSTMTALAQCAPGSVVSGMDVHGSVESSLFQDATIYCTSFDTAGRVVATVGVPITGSGSDTANDSQVQCQSGGVLTSLMADTGAGLDSAEVFCSSAMCD